MVLLIHLGKNLSTRRVWSCGEIVIDVLDGKRLIAKLNYKVNKSQIYIIKSRKSTISNLFW